MIRAPIAKSESRRHPSCKDCHIPPEIIPMLWTKTRDGAKDIFVHFLGESDPVEMHWSGLGASARSKISDSS